MWLRHDTWRNCHIHVKLMWTNSLQAIKEWQMYVETLGSGSWTPAALRGQFNIHIHTRASLMTQLVKNTPAMWETWVWSLGWEDPLRRERLPTPKFWPGDNHGLCGFAESQTGLSDFHFLSSTIYIFSLEVLSTEFCKTEISKSLSLTSSGYSELLLLILFYRSMLL